MPSTAIKSFSYDKEKRILTITFVSGMSYNYKEVPESVYLEMKAFREKGIFLNTRIKGQYKYEKIAS